MGQGCGNCYFGKAVEGVSGCKRVCTNNAGRAVSWVLVCADDKCDNYYVSHAAMLRENGGEAKYKGARVIGLTNGMQTLVDECDWAELSPYKWYMEKSGRRRYVFRKSSKGKTRMHREITGAGAGMVVDHIDHDGLNNRRSNLRVCTIKQNSRNSRGHKGTSKYKGVSWFKEKKKWRASIGCDGRKTTIGYFEKEMDAALAYDEHARELFEEYAYLNFPAI